MNNFNFHGKILDLTLFLEENHSHKYIAMDESGALWLYTDKPKVATKTPIFCCDQIGSIINMGTIDPDSLSVVWYNSLMSIENK